MSRSRRHCESYWLHNNAFLDQLRLQQTDEIEKLRSLGFRPEIAQPGMILHTNVKDSGKLRDRLECYK